MNSKFLTVAVLCLVILAGCARQAFYVSPYNGNHNPYHPVPLKGDSVKSASYAAASISIGTANDREADATFTFLTSFSRAHNFGNFQGFYAADLSLGNYRVAPFPKDDGLQNFDPSAINENAGNKFFGGAGVDGGVNFVLPMRNGEWRVFGIETSAQQEFGDYAAFRRKLTDKDADFIVRNKLFATLGGYTEIVGGIPQGSMGLRLAVGTILGSEYHRMVIDETYDRQLKYNYVNFTFHVTQRKFTGYIQSNFSAKSQSLFLGVNYRLGR